MGFGLWALGFGLWALGFGLWALGFGLWALGFGLWALGFGLWALGFGLEIEPQAQPRIQVFARWTGARVLGASGPKLVPLT